MWLFNNKGIVNFIDEAPVVDNGLDATVRVTAAVPFGKVREIRFGEPVESAGGAFTAKVLAGTWRAYAVE